MVFAVRPVLDLHESQNNNIIFLNIRTYKQYVLGDLEENFRKLLLLCNNVIAVDKAKCFPPLPLPSGRTWR
jgi:hypothetical protein